MTEEGVLESLERFDIDQEQLAMWEAELGLEIPTDSAGNKLYSPLHVNLFKNIKKHLTLGRSLSEIKRLVVLPTASKAMAQPDLLTPAVVAETQYPIETEAVTVNQEEPEPEALPEPEPVPLEPVPVQAVYRHTTKTASEPVAEQAKQPKTLSERLMRELAPLAATSMVAGDSTASPLSLSQGKPLRSKLSPALTPKTGTKRYASPPVKLASNAMVTQQGPHAGLLVLIERLMAEKDDLQSRVTLIEKQKAHLYQANQMFQQRVKGLSEEVESLQAQLRAGENIKLIDNKARLQKQVIEAEQRYAQAEKKAQRLEEEVQLLQRLLEEKFNPKAFVGNWLEEAELVQVYYDNFGINMEPTRSRMFKITYPPERVYGSTALIETTFDYQTNSLWKRTETLTLSLVHENQLQGEMVAEYTLDGTPVAKALYRVHCYRDGLKEASIAQNSAEVSV